MRTWIWLATFIFACGVGSAAAQCTCSAKYRDITAAGEFKLAAAVFVGTIDQIKELDHDPKTDSYDYHQEVVEFTVERSWKQDLGSHVTLNNLIVGCVNGFQKNQKWLIYAYPRKDGTWQAYCCCSRSAPLPKANADIAEIEKLGFPEYRPH